MAGYGRKVENRFNRLKYIVDPLDADGMKTAISPDEVETLNSLGAAGKRRRRHRKHKRLALAVKAVTKARPGETPEQRTKRIAALRSAIAARKAAAAKKHNASRAARRAAWLKKLKAKLALSPATRKKVAQLALKRGLKFATDKAAQYSQLPQAPLPSPLPRAEAVDPPIPENTTPTEAQAVEDMQEEQAEEAYGEEQADEAEAKDEAQAEAEADEAEEEEDDADLSEPSEEEQDEEEAAAAGVGDYDSEMGKKMKRARKVAHRTKVLHSAKKHAVRLHKKSKGKLSAKKTLAGCKLLQLAKSGDKKAKAKVKALEAAAKKGNKKAKAAVLHLKACSNVLRKARKDVSRGLPPSKGLASRSAHQRGLAMIPSTSRRYFG